MALDPVPATLPSSVVLQDDVLAAVAQQDADGGLDVAVLSADLDHWDLFAVADVLSKRQAAGAATDLFLPTSRATSSAAVMPDANAIARALIAPSRAASSSVPRRLLPAPPLSAIDPAEFVWPYPVEPAPFMWDVMGERNWGEVQQVVDGLQRALRASLTPTQQDALIASMQADPKAVLMSAVTPTTFSELVENNPSIAVEYLLVLRNNAPLSAFHQYVARCPRSAYSPP